MSGKRVDRRNVAGPPKSSSGERTVPLPPLVANTLKEHKLASKDHAGFVFPTGTGAAEYHGSIVKRGLQTAWIAAGVTKPDGKAKYSGLHALRHFYASWAINGKGLAALIRLKRRREARPIGKGRDLGQRVRSS